MLAMLPRAPCWISMILCYFKQSKKNDTRKKSIMIYYRKIPDICCRNVTAFVFEMNSEIQINFEFCISVHKNYTLFDIQAKIIKSNK